MILLKLKEYALAALGILAAILGALALKSRGDKYKAQAEQKGQAVAAAEAQRDAVIRANEAAHAASEIGQEEVENAVSKAKTGDRSHFSSGW